MTRWLSLAALVALLPQIPHLVANGHRFPTPAARYAVIISLDGAPPQDLTLAPMPNLHWLLKRGVSYSQAFVGQMTANTPPSHATIGTGLFPAHHGVQGFVWRDPRTGHAVRPADNPAVLQGALERVMAQHRVPSLAADLARDGGRTLTASGHKCYAADAMGTAAATYILCSLIYHDRWVAQAIGSHRPPPGAINNAKWDVPIPSPHSGFAPAVEQWNLGVENNWTVRYALWAFQHAHYPRLMMLNLPETDVIGHFASHPRTVARILMREFDGELGLVLSAYRRAGILDRTVFVITSDHGMSSVHYRLNPGLLDQAIQDAGATKVYTEADTAALIGLTSPIRAGQVATHLADLGGQYVDATFYKVRAGGHWSYRLASARPNVPAALRHAYLLLCNTTAAPEGPDVIAVYAPHITTGDRPAHGYHWMAGHLGPQWDDQHIPFIIAGAGVKHGVVSAYPARLVDIVPTVEQVLGLKRTRTDGTVLWDALAGSSPSQRSAQSRVGAGLLGVVRALRARSR